MHVWLIQQGEPLPTDAGTPRLLRTGLLAEALVEAGHRVTWWATTFNHATKIHRAKSDVTMQVDPAYRLRLLHSPGYSGNISLSRMLDHRILGWRFAHAARGEKSPDIIHCAFPTIELAYEAARFAAQRGVPLVMDARDMWPDIFLDALPRAARGVGRLLLMPDFRMTRYAFRQATAITAHAPGFVDWGLRHAGRERTDRDVDFPFSYPLAAPAAAAAQEATEFWNRAGVRRDDFIVCFFGTFAARREVDLAVVPHAARLLERRAPRIKFVLCGAGPAADRLTQAAAGLNNVIMPGWVDFPRIWTLLRSSSVGLLPYLPSRDFALSMPNKAVEYLSAGLPIVTSLNGGYLAEIIGESRCGAFYAGGDAASLAQVLEQLAADSQRMSAMRVAASGLFEQRLRSDIVSAGMIGHLISLAR